MPDYEQTTSIDVEPDELFDYLAEPHHMPEYLPVLTEADVHDDEVMVELDIHGETQRTEGWLHVDSLERRMEWGAHSGQYHGWLQVDPGDLTGSLLTMHVFQDYESDADDDLLEAMENIRRNIAS